MKTMSIKFFSTIFVVLYSCLFSFGGIILNEKGSIIGVTSEPDGNDYLVASKPDLKQVIKNSKSGKRTSPKELKQAISLPNRHIRSEIEQILMMSERPNAIDKNGGCHEEGLFWGYVNGELRVFKSVSRYAVGTYSQLGSKTYAPLRIFETEDLSVPVFQIDIIGTAHIHPSGTIDDLVFEQEPSSRDIELHKEWEKSGKVKGYSIVIAARERLAYIYNGQGILATLPMDVFLTFG